MSDRQESDQEWVLARCLFVTVANSPTLCVVQAEYQPHGSPPRRANANGATATEAFGIIRSLMPADLPPLDTMRTETK